MPLALLLSASSICIAETSPEPSWLRLLEPLRCSDAIRRELGGWSASEEVLRAPPGIGGQPVYRIATERLGAWVTLQVGGGSAGAATLFHTAPDGTTLVEFGEDCRARRREGPGRPPGGEATTRFTDDDLASLLSRHQALVIYLWSPHLPLSVEGYAQIESATAKRGLAFVAVVHPSADESFVVRAAEEAGIPVAARRRLASVELHFRDLTIHAPSILVYVDGEPEPPLPGYRSEAAYLEYLDEIYPDGAGDTARE